MARRPERNFFEQLKRNLPKTTLPMDLVRVENVALTGHPDVNYCIAGIEGNVELKAWERVRLTGRFTIPKLRPEQCSWLTRRASVGGRAYLMCRINKDIVLFDGRLTPHFFDKDLHLDWAHGATICTDWLKPPYDWDRLARALMAKPATDAEITTRLNYFRKRKVDLGV